MTVLPADECWLSAKVAVRPSPIQGLGLFAVSEIAPGEPVSRLGGRIVSTAELQVLLASATERYIDTVSVFEGQHLVLPEDTRNHFGNHSCNPNLWWADPFSLSARTVVATGVELTVDYGTLSAQPEFEMPCRCRAPNCRGVVTGSDWMREDLQTTYGGHWVPVLRERIQAAQGSR